MQKALNRGHGIRDATSPTFAVRSRSSLPQPTNAFTTQGRFSSTWSAAGNGGDCRIHRFYRLYEFFSSAGCGDKRDIRDKRYKRYKRYKLVDVVGTREGATSDFRDFIIAWKAPSGFGPLAVSRQTLWRETTRRTAILCHRFFDISRVSKSCNYHISNVLRYSMAALGQNGRETRFCHFFGRHLRQFLTPSRCRITGTMKRRRNSGIPRDARTRRTRDDRPLQKKFRRSALVKRPFPSAMLAEIERGTSSFSNMKGMMHLGVEIGAQRPCGGYARRPGCPTKDDQLSS